MKRREFLSRVALATAASLSACSPTVRTAPDQASRPARRCQKTVVLGAGLAGLAAAHELVQAGHDVVVLEARSEAGGRVRTLREPFSDGLHAEAGAAFIPSNHTLTLGYVTRFNLAFEPSTPLFEARLFYVRGQRLVANTANVDWPLELTPEERSLGRPGMWEKYISASLGDAGDVTAPGWPSDPRLGTIDRVSAAEFLRSRGASPAAVTLLRLGYLDLIGDGVDSYSALLMLRDLALRQTETQRYTISGGTDLLPKALAEQLGGKIRYDSPVVRIEPGERSVSVSVAQGGGHQRLTADRVVCTLPLSVLRTIEVSPPFSAQKRQVIEQLSYTSITRTYLQFRRRIWTADNLYVTAVTDLPIRWLYEHTVNQRGPRGILEAQAAGADGRFVARMSNNDRILFALSHVERIFPGIREDFERGTSKSWDDDPWARGAFAYFRPGQMQSFLPHIARPEGRVHFAGEHTSPWSGWMQGALESGLRAAREINQAA